MLVAPESRQNLAKLADIFWDANRNIIATECLWCGNWFNYDDTFLRHLPNCKSPQVKIEGFAFGTTAVLNSTSSQYELPATEDQKPNFRIESIADDPVNGRTTNESTLPPSTPAFASHANHSRQPSSPNDSQHTRSRTSTTAWHDDNNDEESPTADPSAVITAAWFSRQLLKNLEEQASSKSFIICDLCGHSAKSRTQILLHWRTEHLHKSPPPPKPHRTGAPSAERPPKTFACPHCTEIFPTYRLRLLHKQRTHRLHVCEFCGTAFGNPRNLTYHRRIHTGERPYVCQHCQRCFSTPGEHLLHVRMHTGERPYACALCPMRYPLSRLLKAHMRRHAGDRPHACTECPKRFYTSTDLRDHGRSHTGERPYECRMVGCVRRYLSATARNIHEKSTMHVGGVRKPGMEGSGKGGRGLVYKF